MGTADTEVLQRWKRAVINLEGAWNSESDEEFARRGADLDTQRAAGQITEQEFRAQRSQRAADKRSTGTAVFLKDNSRRYLLTARHVIWDRISAERLHGPPPFVPPSMVKQIQYDTRLFQRIFRVPSVDEYIASDEAATERDLSGLFVGSPTSLPFTLTDEDSDLGIVSLDQRNLDFANELHANGFQPITMDDVADQPSAEGAEVFTVGYRLFNFKGAVVTSLS
jgi:hypothetical protein